MTILTTYVAIGTENPMSFTISTALATSIKMVVENGGWTVIYKGDFVYDEFGAVSGDLFSFRTFYNGELQQKVVWVYINEDIATLNAAASLGIEEFNDVLSLSKVSLFGSEENDVLSSGGYVYGNGGDDTITGSAGYDRLYGGEGNDIIYGRAYKDYLYGGEGDDTLHGNGGDDKLYGGIGSDTLYGRADNDTLSGGIGEDTLFGNDGNDVLRGERGSDTLYGGKGDDGLSGGTGADYLFGGLGDDELSGGDGDDVLRGGKGNDTLYGGFGADRLIGGDGEDVLAGGINGYNGLQPDTSTDILTGGANSDLFYFTEPNRGSYVITDFDAAEDLLLFTSYGLRSVTSFKQMASMVDGDVVFDFGDGHTITLENVGKTELDSDNLFFRGEPFI